MYSVIIAIPSGVPSTLLFKYMGLWIYAVLLNDERIRMESGMLWVCCLNNFFFSFFENVVGAICLRSIEMLV